MARPRKPRFKRQKIEIDENGIKHGYRSGLEDKMLKQLESLGIEPNYEGLKIKYIVPEKEHTYTPDFPISSKLIIETKGIWECADRMKMLLIKEQYPELDIRMIFDNANKKIKKGSKTSYAMWCDKHGIKWANKAIPKEWIDEIYEAINKDCNK